MEISANIFKQLQPIEYFRRFLSKNVRPDGRFFDERRKVKIQNAPLGKNTIGSATVKIGNSVVICGIKAEIAEPLPTVPNAGFFVPNIDLPPLSSSKFRVGAPDELTQAISEQINELFLNVSILKLEELCIEPGRACWSIYADIICLNYDGSILDACMYALMASLQSASIPAVSFNNGVTSLVPNKESAPLKLDRLVYNSTFCIFDGHVLIDPTDEEESMASSLFSILIDHDGLICGMNNASSWREREQMGNAESTLAYRKQINSLCEHLDAEKVKDEGFWKAFYQFPESPEIVFNLCAHQEIRTALQKHPENIALLLQKLIDRLRDFINKEYEEFHSTEQVKELLNCVRLITRILPFIYEMEGADEFEKTYLWPSERQDEQCYGAKLVLSACQLLFCRGFTIPSSSEGPMIQYVVWSKGIGATSAPSATKDELHRRVEVLRLLQTLLSKTMYVAPNSEYKNVWTIELTTRLEKKAFLGILCSLINVASEYDPIGWAAIPYNHLLFGDSMEPLVSLSLQCLIGLFDFHYDSTEFKSSESVESLSSAKLPPTSSTDVGYTNMFAFYFSKLYKDEDFGIIAKGLTRLLLNPIDASKAYLPGSTKKLNLTPLILLLLWFLFHANKKFLSYFAQSSFVLGVLQAIITESLDARQNTSKLGSLRLNCFLLQVISQERSFATQLNEPFELSTLGPYAKFLPSFSNGCWADMLYLGVYALLSTNSPIRPQINMLQESYLAALANCAPLITKFSPRTAEKIHSLFVVFSSPRYLLSKERNHVRLFYLLYTIDTILQYQYQGNVQIVYSFVRDKEKALALRDLTFEGAVEIAKQAGSTTGAVFGRTESSTSVGETPLQTPAVAATPDATSPTSAISEKSKGKQAATDGYESVTGFRPTEVWFNEWKARLPIQVLSTLVEKLGPQVENFVSQHELTVDTKVMSYLQTQTMVGVLPQPHPIITHSFVNSAPMQAWVTAHVWGTFYLFSLDPSPAEVAKLCPSIFGGTKAKLFGIDSSSQK